MKKTLITLLSVAALVGCAKENVISTLKDAITFDDSFVEVPTKAAYDGSYTTNSLDEFQVYATIPEANIFNAERVVRGAELGQGTNWSYATANTQYWISGKTYTFRAVANGNVEGVSEVVALEADNYLASAIKLNDASAQKDILYAEEVVTYEGNPQAVKFSFKHVLAKAKFTVKNTIATNNGYSYKVSDIKISGLAKNGVYTVATQTWSEADAPATYDLSFGNAVVDGTAAGAEAAVVGYNGQAESNYERLLIPTEKEVLNISFTYDVIKDGSTVETKVKTIETPELTLVAGQGYNFVISLANPGDPIQFDNIEVEDYVKPTLVYTAEDLKAAVAAGGYVALQNSVELNEALVLTGDVVLDGNGYTLTSTVAGTNGRAINVSGATSATIKNMTIQAAGERAINVIQNSQEVVIENVTAVAANYTVNAAASANGTNITIKDCDLTGLNVVNIAAADATVNVYDTKITCNDQNTSEGYYAIALNQDAANTIVTATRCEIVVNGDSYAGSQGAPNSQLVLVDCTGSNNIKDAYYAIEYGNYYYSFATFEAALEKAEAGETIKLTQDVTVTSHININKSITLDLNGKTFAVDIKDVADGDDAIWVRDYAEVVIKNGAVEVVNSEPSKRYGSAIFATGTTKLTIENLDVIAGGEAVFAQANAQVVINGGTYKSIEHPEFTLSLRDDKPTDTATITVNGGSFYQFNPADNTADGANTNYVAAGKTVTQNGDWYVVE